MDTRKSVFAKLAKLEAMQLGSHRVDFALVDTLETLNKEILSAYQDVLSLLSAGEREYNAYVSAGERVSGTQAELLIASKRLYDLWKVTDAQLQKVEDAAEALGISPNTISGFSEAFENMKTAANFGNKAIAIAERQLTGFVGEKAPFNI